MSSLPATSALALSKSPASRIVGDVCQPRQRLLQRAAKQRMIVGDDELVA